MTKLVLSVKGLHIYIVKILFSPNIFITLMAYFTALNLSNAYLNSLLPWTTVSVDLSLLYSASLSSGKKLQKLNLMIVKL